MGEGVRKSRAKWLAAVALAAAALLLAAQFVSPPEGVALSVGARAFNRLKNRAALPDAADFDERVTLAELLRPGDDRGRWSASRAAAVEGYVVAVREGGVESANSFSLLRRDTHIEVGASPDAPPRERVILEVTPALRDWARGRGMDWTTSALARELTGRRCRFEGWLLFDFNHAGESENLTPGGTANWRATAWEIHPVTSIKVLTE
ncbi:MAG TPA: hypothetical protein VJ866_09470 [Pyrinomonadaceae bacterium]|nr:hypothetical protein [Pyrinomonadaceae bacterium]